MSSSSDVVFLHPKPFKNNKNNHDATLYHIFPEKTATRSSKRTHAESNTEAVISSLHTLHSKLRQLERERDAAVLSERQSNSQSTEVPQPTQHLQEQEVTPPETSDLSDYYLQQIKEESTLLEHKIRDILGVIRSRDVPLLDSETYRTAQPTVVSRTKSEPLKHHNSSISKDRHKISNCHYKLNMKQMPFILSKVPGKTFSLPANIQLLISALKRHNPILCSLTSDCEATLTHILSFEKDLNKVSIVLENTIGYLTTECHELQKQIAPTNDLRHLIVQSQRRDEIMANHDVLLACIEAVKDLQKQIQYLKKQLSAVNGISPNGPPKAKRQSKDFPDAGKKRLPTTKKHFTEGKPSNTRTSHNKKQWDDRVVIENSPKPKPSIDAIQYRELLNVALKRNGLRLKTT